MITKQMIEKGFEKEIISIENEFAGCIGLCCRIGVTAFYFAGFEDAQLTKEEFLKEYNSDLVVEQIYNVLKDSKSARVNGLGEEEYKYYETLINENFKKTA